MPGRLRLATDDRSARAESLPNTRLTEVVELNSEAYLEKIQRFNSLFVPERRLSDLQFLRWKYRLEKPGGGEITRHYGILDERGEIAGQISAQPMEVWIGDKWHQCQYWGDWYRDPAHKGLGLKLLRYVLKQKPLLLATGASGLAYSIYGRMKFVLLPIDQRFVLNCRPLAIILHSLSSPRRGAREFSAWLKKPFARVKRPSLAPGYELCQQKSIDSDLLAGWECSTTRNTVFVRREGWVFSWFLDRFPFSEFRLVVLISGGQQTGYVLLHTRKKENGLVEGKIVDLFARGWNWDHLVTLFREGTHRLYESGVHIIRYHATHPTFVALAEANGFRRVGIQSIIAYGPLTEALSNRGMSLHMTYYDHDEAYY